jgi:hypothetical protein
LVGAGLAVFELVDVFDIFAACVPDELVAAVPAVFETVVVLPLVTVAVFETDIVDAEFVTFALVLFALAVVLFAVSPPQAAPNAARPRNAESAIAFFMLKLSPVFFKD